MTAVGNARVGSVVELELDAGRFGRYALGLFFSCSMVHVCCFCCDMLLQKKIVVETRRRLSTPYYKRMVNVNPMPHRLMRDIHLWQRLRYQVWILPLVTWSSTDQEYCVSWDEVCFVVYLRQGNPCAQGSMPVLLSRFMYLPKSTLPC